MNSLLVHLDFGPVSHLVGKLYLSEKLGRYAFAYDPGFISTRMEISPRILPLGQDTFVADRNQDLYDLPGVFADSLPDEWGKKVQDAEFQKIGLYHITALDRLAFVGPHGLGALRYEPAREFEHGQKAVQLADLRKAVQKILTGNLEVVSQELTHAGGSAGGARPKYLVDLNLKNRAEIRYTHGRPDGDFYPVILKVPLKTNDLYQRVEYAYTVMARKAGIQIPDTFLLIGEKKKLAYFAIKRFDIREDGTRLHTHTLAGLLGINIREAAPDYSQLLRVCGDLTRDHRTVVEAYRRMVFNYLGANCDDHAKNFSFTMDKTGKWDLSPAYDLGYSTSENNLHAMAINGKRNNVTARDLEQMAQNYDIPEWRPLMMKVIKSLEEWPALAKDCGIPKKSAEIIWSRIREHTGRMAGTGKK